jgi:hypothetical protein
MDQQLKREVDGTVSSGSVQAPQSALPGHQSDKEQFVMIDRIQQMPMHDQVHGQEWNKKQQSPTQLNKSIAFEYCHQQVTEMYPNQKDLQLAKTNQSLGLEFDQFGSESPRAFLVAQKVACFNYAACSVC